MAAWLPKTEIMEPTDANVAAVKAAVKSMAGMPKYPTWDPEAQAALVGAFLKKFPTPEAAQQAACEFVEHWSRCPTVNDVLHVERVPGSWAAANEKRAAMHAAQPECPRCANTGWAHVEIPHVENVREFCVCEFGKLLSGRVYGRTNRMEQLRTRGVTCENCRTTGEVFRKAEIPLSAVKRCGCAVGKLAATGKVRGEAAAPAPQRIGHEAAAGRDT